MMVGDGGAECVIIYGLPSSEEVGRTEAPPAWLGRVSTDKRFQKFQQTREMYRYKCFTYRTVLLLVYSQFSHRAAAHQ